MGIQAFPVITASCGYEVSRAYSGYHRFEVQIENPGHRGWAINFERGEWPEVREAVERAIQDTMNRAKTVYHCAGRGWVRPVEIRAEGGKIHMSCCTGWLKIKPSWWPGICEAINKLVDAT